MLLDDAPAAPSEQAAAAARDTADVAPDVMSVQRSLAAGTQDTPAPRSSTG